MLLGMLELRGSIGYFMLSNGNSELGLVTSVSEMQTIACSDIQINHVFEHYNDGEEIAVRVVLNETPDIDGNPTWRMVDVRKHVGNSSHKIPTPEA